MSSCIKEDKGWSDLPCRTVGWLANCALPTCKGIVVVVCVSSELPQSRGNWWGKNLFCKHAGEVATTSSHCSEAMMPKAKGCEDWLQYFPTGWLHSQCRAYCFWDSWTSYVTCIQCITLHSDQYGPDIAGVLSSQGQWNKAKTVSALNNFDHVEGIR